MDSRALTQRFAEAFARRAPLLAPNTTAFRAFNGAADGLPDVTVDWFNGVAVLSLYRAWDRPEEARLVAAAAEGTGARSVYLKRRPREARVVANTAKTEVAPPSAAFGPDVEALVAHENGAAFVIRPGQGLSVGLYLDMRDVRAWVKARAAGNTVLNTFAYTCAFGVYARLGGAARAVNVDLSRRVLDWGEENLRQNGAEPDRRDFIAGDSFEWFRRFEKKDERFDLVILDPPSFSTHKGGRFSAGRDYPKLVEAACAALAPGGTLLSACNLEDLPGPRFEALISSGFERAGRTARLLERLGPSAIDFPAHPDEPSALKVRAHQVT